MERSQKAQRHAMIGAETPKVEEEAQIQTRWRYYVSEHAKGDGMWTLGRMLADKSSIE